jgi:hypothetical protein
MEATCEDPHPGPRAEYGAGPGAPQRFKAATGIDRGKIEEMEHEEANPGTGMWRVVALGRS